MAKKRVEGTVMVAFKSKAEQSDIEKVLEQYDSTKVFNEDELSGVVEEKREVLERLYSLSVPAGTEAKVIKELERNYKFLIEYVQQPPKRKLIM